MPKLVVESGRLHRLWTFSLNHYLTLLRAILHLAFPARLVRLLHLRAHNSTVWVWRLLRRLGSVRMRTAQRLSGIFTQACARMGAESGSLMRVRHGLSIFPRSASRMATCMCTAHGHRYPMILRWSVTLRNFLLSLFMIWGFRISLFRLYSLLRIIFDVPTPGGVPSRFSRPALLLHPT
jgi:hypothetical protein